MGVKLTNEMLGYRRSKATAELTDGNQVANTAQGTNEKLRFLPREERNNKEFTLGKINNSIRVEASIFCLLAQFSKLSSKNSIHPIMD
jgi:hypothetical protein